MVPHHSVAAERRVSSHLLFDANNPHYHRTAALIPVPVERVNQRPRVNPSLGLRVNPTLGLTRCSHFRVNPVSVCGGPDPCCHTQHLRSLRSQRTMSSRPTQLASQTGVGTLQDFSCVRMLLSLPERVHERRHGGHTSRKLGTTVTKLCCNDIIVMLRIGMMPLEHRKRPIEFVVDQTHAATHNICGLRVPRKRCPVVPLSSRLKWELGNYRTFPVFERCSHFPIVCTSAVIAATPAASPTVGP